MSNYEHVVQLHWECYCMCREREGLSCGYLCCFLLERKLSVQWWISRDTLSCLSLSTNRLRNLALNAVLEYRNRMHWQNFCSCFLTELMQLSQVYVTPCWDIHFQFCPQIFSSRLCDGQIDDFSKVSKFQSSVTAHQGSWWMQYCL